MKHATKIIAAYAMLACFGAVNAQNSAAVELHNVAQLAASGSVEVQQDWLTLTLLTTKEGSDAASVQVQLRQALDAALAEAKKAAQPGAMDVRTGAFGLQPRYGRDSKINGWQGSSELVLEGRDFARIGTTAGKIQTLTISSASFSLSRELRTKTETQAQQQAIESFRAKASEIARGFGFAGFTLREVNINANDQGFYPLPRAMAMASKLGVSDAPVPMEAGKSAVVVTVSGTVQLK